MNKFISGVVGIGDAIIFMSGVDRFFKGEEIYMDFDYNIIKHWRPNPESYYDFLINFLNFIKPNDSIIPQKWLLGGTYLHNVQTPFTERGVDFKCINLKDRMNTEKDPSKIILHTKVRALNRIEYDTNKQKIYEILSNSSKTFIILGEREIEYGKEYSILGNNIVYSIYDDIIKYLSKDKIEDLTIPKLGITNPNLENLIKDIEIISKHKNICIGSGGNYQICSSFSDVIGVVDRNDGLNIFLDKYQTELKDMNNFLNELPNFIK